MEETAKGAAAKQADGAEAEAGLKEQENEDWRQGLRGMSAKTVASFSPQGVRKVSTFSERSLFLLSKDNPLRVAVMRVIVSKKFDNFIFMLIILNCVTLAMGSNEPNFDETSLGKFLALTEWFFTPLFCLEMVLKVVGMGFFLKPGAYLRDGWNVLDFLVVVLGLVASSGLIGNYTSIRTVRVLRPLRTLTAVEGLRKLVVTLMSALPMLGNVLLLCGFLFFILGIVGIQTFAERMRNRCGYEGIDFATGLLNYTAQDAEGDLCSGPMYPMPLDSLVQVDTDALALQYARFPHLCTDEALLVQATAAPCAWLAQVAGTGQEEEARAAQWASNPDTEGEYDGLDRWHSEAYDGKRGGGRNCPLDGDGNQLVCIRTENPAYNIISFDNILWAWLTIFTCVSMEGWTDVMYSLQDGESPWVWIYFLVLIIFGSFYAINLALAVLYLYFTQDDDAGGEQEKLAELAEAVQKDKALIAHEDGEKSANGGREHGHEVPVQTASGLVRGCQALIETKTFEFSIIALIIINTIVMAAEFDGMSDATVEAFDAINYLLTVSFAVEMIIKLIALGFSGYREDAMNVFDGTIVVLSFVEIFVTLATGAQGGGMFSVLRAFRLLRVFKLARSWKELNSIITTIFKSVASITYLSLILVLFIFIFALLGMQLFGYKYQFCDDGEQMCPAGGAVQGVPSFLEGGAGCGKHRECYVAEAPDGTTPCAELFECSLPGGAAAPCDAFIANTVPGLTEEQLETVIFSPEVPSLVLDRALVGGVATAGCVMYKGENDDGDYVVEGARYVGRPYRPRHNFDNIYWSIITIFQVLTGENWNEVMYDGMFATSDALSLYFLLLFSLGNYIILNLFLAILLDNFGGNDDDEEDEDEGGKAEDSDDSKTQDSDDSKTRRTALEGEVGSGGKSLRRLLSETSDTSKVQSAEERLEGLLPESNSLFVLSVGNPLRRACAQVVSNSNFELFIIGAILASSMLLALDSNVLMNDNSTSGTQLRAALYYLDVFFVALFCLEFVLKVITLGFVAHPGSYLRSGWNVLDFLIVIVGVVGLAASGGALNALRALRTFRALRPLRMASRAPGIKVIVNALFKAIPGIGNVALVCALFYLIFGILGLNLLLGKLRYCGFACDSNAWALSEGQGGEGNPYADACGENLEVVDFPMLAPRAGHLDLAAVMYPPGFVEAESGELLRDSSGDLMGGMASVELDRDFCRVPSLPLSAFALTAADEWAASKAGALGWWADNGFVQIDGDECQPDARGRAKVSCIRHGVSAADGEAAFRAALAAGGAAGAEIDEVVDEWTTGGGFESPIAAAIAEDVSYYNFPTGWMNRDKRFDNIFVSILTLFEVATLEMFLDTMYQAIDSTGFTSQPIRDTNPALALYFVFFIIIGSFFVMNLFVGVTIDKFNEMKAKSEDGASLFLTPEQQAWVTIQRMLTSAVPVRRIPPPAAPSRQAVFNVVQTEAFDGFIMVCILGNILFMSMRTADISDAWETVLFWANFAFALIFFLEMLMKMFALGMRNYFANSWNKFDFVVVLSSIVGITMDVSMDGEVPVVGLLRVFRVARIFRLVPRAKGLKTLFQTLIFSLPALINVGSVLLLFFFIYSIMGMNLFGQMRYGENLNRHANFRDFPSAMMTLFRMATGESWNGIMWDAMVVSECQSLTGANYLLDYSMPEPADGGVFPSASEYDMVDMQVSPLRCPVENAFPASAGVPQAEAAIKYASSELANTALVEAYGADGLPPTCAPWTDEETGLDWLVLTLSDGTICERIDQTAEELYFDSSSPCIELAKEWYGKLAAETRCSPWEGAALIYFCSFVIICALIILNLVIAVIIDEILASSDAETLPVVQENMENYIEVWQELDEEGNFFIPREVLPQLISRLDPPLGIRGLQVDEAGLLDLMGQMEISVTKGQINFHETLHALAGRVAAHPLPAGVENEVRAKLMRKLTHLNSGKGGHKYTAGHYHAAEYVQAAVRGFLTRYRLHVKMGGSAEDLIVGSSDGRKKGAEQGGKGVGAEQPAAEQPATPPEPAGGGVEMQAVPSTPSAVTLEQAGGNKSVEGSGDGSFKKAAKKARPGGDSRLPPL